MSETRTVQERLRKWWREVVLERASEHPVATLIALWITSFALGVWGYWVYDTSHGVDPWLPQEIYRSLQLFTFKGGEKFAHGPWQLEIARWSSPAIAAYTALKGLVAVFYDQLQTLRAMTKRQHVVVCGLSEKGRLIAKKFLDDGQNVVVVEKDMHGRGGEVQAMRADGAIVIAGTAAEPAILRVAGVSRARLLIATCDDETNAAILYVATGLRAKAKDHLDCLVHMKTPGLDSYLWKQADEINQLGRLSVRFFNLEASAAKTLVGQYPAFSLNPEDGSKEPAILLTGDDSFLGSMVEALAERWMLRTLYSEQRLRLIPLTEWDQATIEEACARQPLISDHVAVLAPGAPGCEIDQAWVLNSDSIQATSNAVDLQDTLEHATIHVRHQRDAGLALWLRSTTAADRPQVSVFSIYEDTCASPDLLLGVRRESLAKLIHARYLESYPGLDPWSTLDEQNRDANRNQADWISRMISDLGYQVEASSRNIEEPLRFSENETRLLARVEHRRWCMQKMLKGWKYGLEKNSALKTHPDLVPWEQLNASEQLKDLDAVRGWPSLLAHETVRFAVVREFETC